MLETSARLLRLLSLFQGRRSWSGHDLAARLEVTSRKLRRDIDKLRTPRLSQRLPRFWLVTGAEFGFGLLSTAPSRSRLGSEAARKQALARAAFAIFAPESSSAHWRSS